MITGSHSMRHRLHRRGSRPVGAGLLVLAFIGLIAAPNALALTTWPTMTPDYGATIGTANIVEAEALDDSYAIVSGTLTINGVTRAPLFITGIMTTDVYITFDPAQGGLLSPGANHAVATVTNSQGTVSSQAWDFTVNTPPTITASSPANDALVTNTTSPAVSVTLSDPDDSTFTGQFSSGRAFTVDGGTVASSFNSATKTYSFTRSYSPLVWHTIVFSVKDSAGNPAEKSWRFMVDTSPDTTKPTLSDPNPIPGSTTNPKPQFSITAGDNRPGNVSVDFTLDGAPVYSTVVTLPTANATQLVKWTPASNLSPGSHTVGADAADAAGNKAVRQTWSFTVADNLVASHTTSTSFATCTACHSTVLTTEHENRGFTCNTCHGASAPQKVQDAIAAKQTACGICHDAAATGHAAVHDGGFSQNSCVQCHDRNISDEHEGACALCHESSSSTVQAAIASGTVTCTACHARPHAGQEFGGASDPSQGRAANIYMRWSDLVAPTVTANTGSPHGGYLTSTVKCAVCHSSHTAAPGGGPVGSAGTVADTLLRVKAADACGYCHVAAANAVMSPVFGGVWPVPVEAGHSLGGNNCAECHTGPHGVGAETLPALNGKLLTLATDYAPVGSTILSRVAAIEATAVAQGFGADPKVTGYNVAEYSSAAAFAASPAMELQAVGVFCGGCHEGSYASTVANASASNKGGLAAGQFSGHRTMAAATTTWNAAGNKKSSGYQANIKIADAPAQDCYSCHDADNGFGEKAFPHNWGVPAGETLVYDSGLNEFENQTFAWLLRAPDSSGPKTGVDASGKTAHVSATGGTLSDGVCLKCHKWTAGGVGQTF